MPRKRELYANTPHHVMLRGNNRRRLFSYPREYEHFLWCIAKAHQLVFVPLHAIALMPNHVHLIATPNEPADLSLFIKSLSQRYATFRNRERGGSGKLFEQRFHSVAIRSVEQLAVTTAYVDLNPVRACMVDDPAEYEWSTFRLHAGMHDRSRISPRLWRPSAWYLALGPERYIDFVAEQRKRDAKPEAFDFAETAERHVDRRRYERPDRSSAI